MHRNVHGPLHGLVEPGIPDVRTAVTARTQRNVTATAVGEATSNAEKSTVAACVLSTYDRNYKHHGTLDGNLRKLFSII